MLDCQFVTCFFVFSILLSIKIGSIRAIENEIESRLWLHCFYNAIFCLILILRLITNEQIKFMKIMKFFGSARKKNNNNNTHTNWNQIFEWRALTIVDNFHVPSKYNWHTKLVSKSQWIYYIHNFKSIEIWIFDAQIGCFVGKKKIQHVTQLSVAAILRFMEQQRKAIANKRNMPTDSNHVFDPINFWFK